ncbi:MAG: hypothetical protein LBV59_11875 [Sphingobacterium sp.]|uniref:hypothetical protein n=1 Tax=Sphingobacterium sp. TaxID=341027 RepID=UPI002846AB26|nr:hypothetical protein [Sphingobacterium sp.]MDR3008627.1 hypothetical protein [Sphingobacterium sp.]
MIKFNTNSTIVDADIPNYKSDEILTRLKAYSIGKFQLDAADQAKCYYCESYGAHVASFQVEHFRPKKSVNAQDTNGVAVRGYPWLSIDWHNLLLSCPACNSTGAKGTRFPIAGVRAVTPHCNLTLEQHMLINPEIEDPATYITFNDLGQMRGIGNGNACKGNVSIGVYTLNRDALVVNRLKIWKDLSSEICEAVYASEKGWFGFLKLSTLYTLVIKKIIKTQNNEQQYALWGRYINENIEQLVGSLIIKKKYKSKFLRLYKRYAQLNN